MMAMNDTDVSIFIITNDGDCIYINEYDREYGGDFVMVTNERLNHEYRQDNSICIYKKWLDELKQTKQMFIEVLLTNVFTPYERHSVGTFWQIEKQILTNNSFGSKSLDYNDTYDDVVFDGFSACQQIKANVTTFLKGCMIERYIPAIMVAYHTEVEYNGMKVHGYLPAIGQLQTISKNVLSINNAIMTISDGNKDNCISVEMKNRVGRMSTNWWSSTEFDSEHSWTLIWSEEKVTSKKQIENIIPLYFLKY